MKKWDPVLLRGLKSLQGQSGLLQIRDPIFGEIIVNVHETECIEIAFLDEVPPDIRVDDDNLVINEYCSEEEWQAKKTQDRSMFH